MRLVAVTRVLDEDDILEAFVRHHAALVDHHIFLDNGSTDRSLAILQALRAEGLSLSVLQTRAAHFCEAPVLTALYGMAARLGADWVLMLDCDEFVDDRRAEGGLRARLEAVPPEQGVAQVDTNVYHLTPADDANDPLVPRRIRHREPATRPIAKVFVRGALAGRGLGIDAGSHSAVLEGRYVPALQLEDVVLAHYQRRSPWRGLAKAVIGRLKVIAAGQNAAEHSWSVHYNKVFEAVRNDPATLLRDPAFLAPAAPEGGLVEDPIAYRGAEPMHSVPGDPVTKAIATLAAYGEVLANQHARLLDTNEGVRLQLHNIALTWTQVL